MDRKQSYVSDQTPSGRHQHHPILPPWEVRAMSQVPFIEPGSPPIMERDNQGFFNPRASAYPKGRPRLTTTTSAPPCSSEYASPVSDDSNSCPWKGTGPVPAVAPPPLPPYETSYGTPGHMPTVPKKSTSVSAYPVQAPPTPPESFTRASDRSASASPPTVRASKALPGTMSSRAGRDKENIRPRAKSSSGRSRAKESKPDAKPLGKRFRSAFKEMFRKDPVDESQFEKITAQHWTDEY